MGFGLGKSKDLILPGMMHDIKVWCPYHKQAVLEETVGAPPVVAGASGGGAAASSSSNPPAKRQRIDDPVFPEEQEAEGVAVDICSWQGSYGDLGVHLKKDCQFHKIPCPLGCGVEVKRSGVPLHKATECRYAFFRGMRGLWCARENFPYGGASRGDGCHSRQHPGKA